MNANAFRLILVMFRHAVLHWLTGLVFAFVVGLCVLFVAPLVPGMRMVARAVETRGVDTAMRLLWTVAPPSLDRETEGNGYVFIDIDSVACNGMIGGKRCNHRSPAASGLVADLAAAALKANPRVLIIDSALWDSEASEASDAAAMDRLSKAAISHPDSPVVAVAPFRPDGQPRSGLLDPELIPKVLREGPIRFAPAMIWTSSNADDGVIRGFPASASVTVDERGRREMATLPYIAALYAAAGRRPAVISVVNCGAGTLNPTPTPNCAGRSPVDGLIDQVRKSARGADEGAPILFSLRTLAGGSGNRRSSYAGRFQGVYDRYPASMAMNNYGSLTLAPALLEDKIVIISTSAQTALDWHDTPLGSMTGAEVILNAVRAFLGHGILAKPDAISRFLHEVFVVGASSIPFLVFWFAFFALKELRITHLSVKLIAPICTALGFCSAIAVAMAIAAFVTLNSLSKDISAGFAVEFFTPIFALSLEGFAESGRWLIDRTERLIDRLIPTPNITHHTHLEAEGAEP